MSKAASSPRVKPTGTSRETEAGSSLTWPRGGSAELWDGPRWPQPWCPWTAAVAAKSLQLRLTLCDPIDGSPRGSPVPGILQARTLEWAAHSFSNAWKWKVKSESEVAQSCPTLCDLMNCSLPGSSVHGIFQARVLEWGAVAFSDNF